MGDRYFAARRIPASPTTAQQYGVYKRMPNGNTLLMALYHGKDAQERAETRARFLEQGDRAEEIMGELDESNYHGE